MNNTGVSESIEDLARSEWPHREKGLVLCCWLGATKPVPGPMSLESPEEGSEGNCKFNSGKAAQARESRLERSTVLVGGQAIGVFAPDNLKTEP